MPETTSPTPLLTQWGEALDKQCPLPEYPRPQMERPNWQCHNGPWRYAIVEDTAATPAAAPPNWDGEILVPFSPESPLSGVGRQLLPGQTLWYGRDICFDMPQKGERLLLHFGAVDQACTVYVGGRQAGSHAGGYWPFCFDITELVQEGANTITLAVTDLSNTGDEAYGKQTLDRGNIWYTGQSGIWQTVWSERVPQNHIAALRITPLYREGAVRVQVVAGGGAEGRPALPGQVKVLCEGAMVALAPLEDGAAVVTLGNFRSWSPEDPFLYQLEVTCGADTVGSYFGMREFGLGQNRRGQPCLMLNGKPIFHNGLLDQGYWSDGMYTPPSDEAMVWDITQTRAMGFNMLRKHIKIEPMRWYYHCDRLGMLVWQDFVSGGGPYRDFVIRYAPWLGINYKDGPGRYATHGRASAKGRQNYLRDLERTVELLYNVASLAVWVPFNEGWGQFDAVGATRRVRQLDSTRQIDHASGYFDQGAGDFHSYHIYFKHFVPKPDKRGKNRVLALTEFGGYSLPVPGHMFNNARYGYKLYENQPALQEALSQLYEADIFPAVPKGLGALVYTQVSDVEDEINGLFTYDRRGVKVDMGFIQEINRRVYMEFLGEG